MTKFLDPSIQLTFSEVQCFGVDQHICLKQWIIWRICFSSYDHEKGTIPSGPIQNLVSKYFSARYVTHYQ